MEFRIWSYHSESFEDIDKEDYGLVFDGADGLEIMRVTGMADKNGKMICENDIVRYSVRVWDEAGYKIAPQKRPALVTYNDASAAFIVFTKSFNPLHSLYFIEIIGNKYENPELLKEKNFLDETLAKPDTLGK